MKLLLLTLLALLVPAQFLHAGPSLTVDEALVTALKNHPQIIEAKENLNGAEARTGQAHANYYPQISIAADWSRGRSYLTALQNSKTTEVTTEALYLKQTIFDFGRTSGAVDAARSNRDAAGHELSVTRQEVALRVKSAFYLLLAAEKQVVAATGTVKAREAVHHQAQEFFSQGIRGRVDAAKAEATLFSAQTSLIRAENNREIAKVELANSMGIASLADSSLVEPSVSRATLSERRQAQLDAVHNRAELQQLAALKSAASSNLHTAKSGYLPILSGTANVGYADRDFPPAGNVWGVGLNLTMPLFSGFSSVEQVREAAATINGIEARNSNIRIQIIKEVDTAWLGVNEAAARIISTEKEVAAAYEARSLSEGRYSEGVGTIIEVSDSQSQHLDAQTAHIQAQYDYFIAVARLDRATGKE